MRILYLSVHEILEYDELKIFTELGHECFSHGSYADPHRTGILRPPILEMPRDPAFIEWTNKYPRDQLPPELIEDKDVIIIMHEPSFVVKNWQTIKHKRVIWRSIGQSVASTENTLRPYRDQGLEVVRYSPLEERIPGYIGEDAMIRFYKDPDEYKGWDGCKEEIMALNQSIKQRRVPCNYDYFESASQGLPVKLFGPGNEEVPQNAGVLSFDEMKHEMRSNRAFLYTGTHPASYTLGFIEAFMTGIPIVSIGPNRGNSAFYKQQTFEIPQIIHHGKDGFVTDEVSEARAYLEQLLKDDKLAGKMSRNARKQAIKLFGKKRIRDQWKQFLENG